MGRYKLSISTYLYHLYLSLSIVIIVYISLEMWRNYPQLISGMVLCNGRMDAARDIDKQRFSSRIHLQPNKDKLAKEMVRIFHHLFTIVNIVNRPHSRLERTQQIGKKR